MLFKTALAEPSTAGTTCARTAPKPQPSKAPARTIPMPNNDPSHLDQLKAAEERDQEWLTHVYRGDKEKDLMEV